MYPSFCFSSLFPLFLVTLFTLPCCPACFHFTSASARALPSAAAGVHPALCHLPAGAPPQAQQTGLLLPGLLQRVSYLCGLCLNGCEWSGCIEQDTSPTPSSSALPAFSCTSSPLFYPFCLLLLYLLPPLPSLYMQVHVATAGAAVEGGREPWPPLLHPDHHEAEQGCTRAGQLRGQQGEGERDCWWVGRLMGEGLVGRVV